MRDVLSTVVSSCGLVLVSVGAFLMWQPLGVVVGGACLVAVGELAVRE